VQLAADQLCGLATLLEPPFLKAPQRADPKSKYIIPLCLTVILSDLLRIPDSYYPPAFHAALLRCLIAAGAKREEDVCSHFTRLILKIVGMIGTRDPGCYARLVKFLSFTISLTAGSSFDWCWFDGNLAVDVERLFVRDVVQECFLMGNAGTVKALP
jgi:hypothetical protein